MRTAVITAEMFGSRYETHPELASDSFLQRGPAYWAKFVKNDFFHFLLLSSLFDSAGSVAASITEVLPGIRPAFFACVSNYDRQVNWKLNPVIYPAAVA